MGVVKARALEEECRLEGRGGAAWGMQRSYRCPQVPTILHLRLRNPASSLREPQENPKQGSSVVITVF